MSKTMLGNKNNYYFLDKISRLGHTGFNSGSCTQSSKVTKMLFIELLNLKKG